MIHCVNCGPFFVPLAFQSRVLLGRQAPQEARWGFDRSQGCRGHWHIEVCQHYGPLPWFMSLRSQHDCRCFQGPDVWLKKTIWSPFRTNLFNPPVLSKLFLRNPCVDYPYLIPCFAQEPPRPRSHGAAATQVHHVSNVDVGTCNNSWILLLCTEFLRLWVHCVYIYVIVAHVFQLNCHGVFLNLFQKVRLSSQLVSNATGRSSSNRSQCKSIASLQPIQPIQPGRLAQDVPWSQVIYLLNITLWSLVNLTAKMKMMK